MDIVIFFLPMILFLGAVTGYEDIKLGKIRNKWLVFALLYALIAYLVAISYYSSIGAVRMSYFQEYLIMIAFTALVAFVMYWASFWTAGDGKLFIVFAVLVPLSVYKYGFVPYLSSTNLLINTMVPFFLFYIVVLAVRTKWSQKVDSAKKLFNWKRLGILALFLFSFSWPVELFFSYFQIPGNFFFVVFVLFLMLFIVDKIFGRHLVAAMVLLSLLRIAFDRTLLTMEAWMAYIWSYVLFLFVIFYVLYLGYDYMSRVVDIRLLKPGMVPAQIVYKEGDKYIREDILHVSLLSYLYDKTIERDYIIEPRPEGLHPEDVERIKSVEDKLIFEHLRVYKTLHFAPFLFIGTLLTILFQGNMFIALFVMIQ
jgi:hypothetical protein